MHVSSLPFMMSKNCVYDRQLLFEIKASYNLILKQTATGQGHGLPPPPFELPVPAYLCYHSRVFPHPGRSAQGNGENELVHLSESGLTSMPLVELQNQWSTPLGGSHLLHLDLP